MTAKTVQAPPAAQDAADYASCSIQLDHLLSAPHNGHTVVRVVFSTETAVETLLAQLSYFGMHQELASTGLINLLSAAQDRAAVFALRARDDLTNVIVDNAILAELLDPASKLGSASNPEGTLAGAHGALIMIATDLLRTAAAQTGVMQRVVGWVSDND